MRKIKKYEVLAMLDVFREKECETIDDIINLLNEDIEQEDATAFTIMNDEVDRSEEEYEEGEENDG